MPRTADDCFVVLGDRVWNADQWSNNAVVIFCRDKGYGAVFHTQWRPIECCYSSRTAAEAAENHRNLKAMNAALAAAEAGKGEK